MKVDFPEPRAPSTAMLMSCMAEESLMADYTTGLVLRLRGFRGAQNNVQLQTGRATAGWGERGCPSAADGGPSSL